MKGLTYQFTHRGYKNHLVNMSNMNVNELGVSERVNVPIHASWLQESLGEYE